MAYEHHCTALPDGRTLHTRFGQDGIMQSVQRPDGTCYVLPRDELDALLRQQKEENIFAPLAEQRKADESALRGTFVRDPVSVVQIPDQPYNTYYTSGNYYDYSDYFVNDVAPIRRDKWQSVDNNKYAALFEDPTLSIDALLEKGERRHLQFDE